MCPIHATDLQVSGHVRSVIGNLCSGGGQGAALKEEGARKPGPQPHQKARNEAQASVGDPEGLLEEDLARSTNRFSNGRNPAYVWLRELGLSQYAAGFEAAGYADWELLGCLEEKDLAMIELHANCTILPGHRKKILMASHQMGQKGSQHRLSKSGGARPSSGGAGSHGGSLGHMQLNRVSPLNSMYPESRTSSRTAVLPIGPGSRFSSSSKDLIEALPQLALIGVAADLHPRTGSASSVSSLKSGALTMLQHNNLHLHPPHQMPHHQRGSSPSCKLRRLSGAEAAAGVDGATAQSAAVLENPALVAVPPAQPMGGPRLHGRRGSGLPRTRSDAPGLMGLMEVEESETHHHSVMSTCDSTTLALGDAASQTANLMKPDPASGRQQSQQTAARGERPHARQMIPPDCMPLQHAVSDHLGLVGHQQGGGDGETVPAFLLMTAPVGTYPDDGGRSSSDDGTGRLFGGGGRHGVMNPGQRPSSTLNPVFHVGPSPPTSASAAQLLGGTPQAGRALAAGRPATRSPRSLNMGVAGLRVAPAAELGAFAIVGSSGAAGGLLLPGQHSSPTGMASEARSRPPTLVQLPSRFPVSGGPVSGGDEKRWHQPMVVPTPPSPFARQNSTTSSLGGSNAQLARVPRPARGSAGHERLDQSGSHGGGAHLTPSPPNSARYSQKWGQEGDKSSGQMPVFSRISGEKSSGQMPVFTRISGEAVGRGQEGQGTTYPRSPSTSVLAPGPGTAAVHHRPGGSSVGVPGTIALSEASSSQAGLHAGLHAPPSASSIDTVLLPPASPGGLPKPSSPLQSTTTHSRPVPQLSQHSLQGGGSEGPDLWLGNASERTTPESPALGLSSTSTTAPSNARLSNTQVTTGNSNRTTPGSTAELRTLPEGAAGLSAVGLSAAAGAHAAAPILTLTSPVIRGPETGSSTPSATLPNPLLLGTQGSSLGASIDLLQPLSTHSASTPVMTRILGTVDLGVQDGGPAVVHDSPAVQGHQLRSSTLFSASGFPNLAQHSSGLPYLHTGAARAALVATTLDAGSSGRHGNESGGAGSIVHWAVDSSVSLLGDLPPHTSVASNTSGGFARTSLPSLTHGLASAVSSGPNAPPSATAPFGSVNTVAYNSSEDRVQAAGNLQSGSRDRDWATARGSSFGDSAGSATAPGARPEGGTAGTGLSITLAPVQESGEGDSIFFPGPDGGPTLISAVPPMAAQTKPSKSSSGESCQQGSTSSGSVWASQKLMLSGGIISSANRGPGSQGPGGASGLQGPAMAAAAVPPVAVGHGTTAVAGLSLGSDRGPIAGGGKPSYAIGGSGKPRPTSSPAEASSSSSAGPTQLQQQQRTPTPMLLPPKVVASPGPGSGSPGVANGGRVGVAGVPSVQSPLQQGAQLAQQVAAVLDSLSRVTAAQDSNSGESPVPPVYGAPTNSQAGSSTAKAPPKAALQAGASTLSPPDSSAALLSSTSTLGLHAVLMAGASTPGTTGARVSAPQVHGTPPPGDRLQSLMAAKREELAALHQEMVTHLAVMGRPASVTSPSGAPASPAGGSSSSLSGSGRIAWGGGHTSHARMHDARTRPLLGFGLARSGSCGSAAFAAAAAAGASESPVSSGLADLLDPTSALAEVESRIRTKLRELAKITEEAVAAQHGGSKSQLQAVGAHADTFLSSHGSIDVAAFSGPMGSEAGTLKRAVSAVGSSIHSTTRLRGISVRSSTDPPLSPSASYAWGAEPGSNPCIVTRQLSGLQLSSQEAPASAGGDAPSGQLPELHAQVMSILSARKKQAAVLLPPAAGTGGPAQQLRSPTAGQTPAASAQLGGQGGSQGGASGHRSKGPTVVKVMPKASQPAAAGAAGGLNHSSSVPLSPDNNNNSQQQQGQWQREVGAAWGDGGGHEDVRRELEQVEKGIGARLRAMTQHVTK